MIKLHLGDCRELLASLDDNSVDAIVTDPPYGLAFMNKHWDYDVPSVDIWAECLRVLKPGGHLLAFAGTRTQHRMAARIEDAGFEIRDMIAWVYGSGFPKSLDVSKAIDKAGGDPIAWRAFSEAYAVAVKASKFTHSDIDRVLGIKSSSCYWARIDHRGGMPPRHHWEKVRDLLCLPDGFEVLYEEAERETIATVNGSRLAVAPGQENDRSGRELDVTAPATDAARQWQGWGTALKPALEPITVARKPLIGTVAENVLKHGVGALNIDGCRVPSEKPTGWGGGGSALYEGGLSREGGEARPADGRWPANLIHDGSDEVLAAFPHTESGAMKRTVEGYEGDSVTGFLRGRSGPHNQHGDSGSAARFFYAAKASRKDRNEGCEELMTWENVDLSRAVACLLELQKVTSDVTTLLQDDTAWSMSSFGKLQTALFRQGIRSITEMKTRPTTGSTTSNCSPHWNTNVFIQDAISTFEGTGSSLVDCAEFISQLTQATTCEKTASVLGAVHAALLTLCDAKKNAKIGNAHSTVKPTELMRYLCRLVTPPGGVVLDPFAGSGSTGKAAVLEGFRFIGAEQDAAHHAVAQNRIDRALYGEHFDIA